jgi:DNA-binding transcriptional ArsR family regulator
MSDSNINSPVDTPVTPPVDAAKPEPVAETAIHTKKARVADTAKLEPVAMFFALASHGRWPIVRFLADGRAASVSEIGAAIGLERDLTAKQLRVLRDAGVLESRDGEDRRQTLYQIPAARRPSPGVIDYGFCVLHMDKL